MSDITLHACLCEKAIKIASEGKPPIRLETEVRTLGLASVLMAQCLGCNQKFTVDSSPKVPGSKRHDVNVRAVWGEHGDGQWTISP